jgi:NAD(P)-dependent dehydrogenase (short-subunit alcohol dehydrogenase family)
MKTFKELADLKGRVALITGGAGHIGFAMAETLAEMGSDIVLLDIQESECARKAKRIRAQYRVKAFPLCIDLADDKDVRRVPDIVKKELGRLDILIHCAALVGTSKLKGWAAPFEDQSLEAWRKAFDINLTAVFALTQSCRDLLLRSKHGSVINISSIYGMGGPVPELYKGTGLGNPAAYSASKGGLLQLTRWLATSLAPDVRVNAISIGGVFRNHKEPFLSRYEERTPLKRMAKEEDLKGAVAYLASDLSNYVTGHNLVVDGGWTAW